MVKYVRDNTNRFSLRPHYLPLELDRACEQIITKFLNDRHERVNYPISTDDLTLLIERDTEDFDSHADLSIYGSEVEGVTEFQPGRKPKVKISADLASAERRENRLRTTLTHEYAHVHFHAYLWDMEPPARDLLRQNPNANKQICKRDNLLDASQTDWMEWQAGYACGALLMPISHLRRVVAAYQEAHNLFGAMATSGVHGQAVIQVVQKEFRVSADAARIRLLKLKFLSSSGSGPSLFST